MASFRSRMVVFAVVILAGLFGTACRRTFVVVPRPSGGYTRMDTLYGRSDGRNVRVTFHFDTTWRRDTVVRLDTMWIGGTRTIVRIDTVLRRDTVVLRAPLPMTSPMRVDTVRIIRRDTLFRRDTIVLRAPAPVTSPMQPGRVDTVRVVVRDTVRVVVRDTVFRRDTIRVAGRRTLFVPPGQYPPEGQCRIWMPDLPPGRQANAAPCHALGAIPAGAFILYGGESWDADYDWVLESGRSSVPPVIVGLTRNRGRP